MGIASKSGGKRETQAGYSFISPFFILFVAFGLLPILFTAYVSLFNWDILGTKEFIGLRNFTSLLTDDRFYGALRNTMSIWLLSSCPQLVMALGLAVVLNRKTLKFRTFWRAIVLLPFITSTVAVALVFGAVFADHGGIANWASQIAGLSPIAWHADTLPSHLAIATMVNWRWTGYNALIYLAALQSIPKDLYESAEVDGASKWRQFISITIPQIRPTLIFTIIITTIGGLQIFAEPYQFGQATYNGGSNGQYRTLTLFMFDQAFAQSKLGYASATALVLFFIIAIAVGINFLLSRRLVAGD